MHNKLLVVISVSLSSGGLLAEIKLALVGLLTATYLSLMSRP
jgi:hypothetical protein